MPDWVKLVLFGAIFLPILWPVLAAGSARGGPIR
jgi:hypothetical protein